MALTKSRNRMRAGAPVSVLDYGAVLDGVTDDTAAWNAALATGRVIEFPEGQSRITNRLNFSATEGSSITGAGRYKSQFLVSYSTFNMSTDSVIKMNAAHQGLRHLGIIFDQPSTSIRASVKQYPNAIYLNGYSRPILHSLLIQAGWVGIAGQGNTGGAVIDDIQTGCFFHNLLLDGAADSVRISRFHVWPFGIAGDANLMLVWQDNNTIGMDLGRVDDIHITDCLVFSARIRMLDYGTGFPTGTLANLALDSKYSWIEMTAGKMTMSNVNGGTNVTNQNIINIAGGELKINGLAMECGTQHLPLVSVTGGTFICSNIFVTSFGFNSSVFRQTGGRMFLSNGYLEAATINRAAAMIDIVSGRAVVTGIRASDSAGATGDFIKIATDDFHTITGNQPLGWSISIPSSPSVGIYRPNGGVASSASGTYNISPTHRKRLTGTLNSSGAATVAHSVTNAHLKVVSMAAFSVGTSNERTSIPTVTIDATNVILGGGVASRPFEVWVEHS